MQKDNVKELQADFNYFDTIKKSLDIAKGEIKNITKDLKRYKKIIKEILKDNDDLKHKYKLEEILDNFKGSELSIGIVDSELDMFLYIAEVELKDIKQDIKELEKERNGEE